MKLPQLRLPWWRTRREKVARRPGLEALEDRCLLNASAPSQVIDLSGLSVNTAQYSPTDILVQFKPGSTPGGQTRALPGTRVGQLLPLVSGLYEVQLNPGVTVSQALAEYRADPRVLQADPDYALTTAAVPNNPMFNQQWALLNTGQGGGTPGADIGVTHAWSVTTGNPQTIVALMDTGVDYDQQDLYQNVWINQAEIPKSRLAPSLGGTNPNGIQDYFHDGFVSWRDLNDPRNIGPGKIADVNGDGIIDAADILAPMVLNAQGQDTGNGGWAYAGNTQDGDTAHPNDFIGWNFVDNNNNPLDKNGHGTHVAGIVGAMGNSGVGVAGIDWRVSLMPVQFLNASGNGSISAFISGLNYAVQHGAKISNNSWSGATNDPLLQSAVSSARSAGVIFVAAAGNGGTNNDSTPTYPASFNLDNVVSVAATDNNDNLASFSNYGPTSVDLAAPGVNVISTLPNNTYGAMSGTSMATPMVSGVLALVWGQHPTWTYQQVISQVLNTTDPVPSLQGKVLTGGVLDAARAVGFNPTPPAPTPPPSSGPLQVVSATATGSVANTLDTIVLTFSAPVDASTLNNTNIALVAPSGLRVMFTSFLAVPGSGGTQVTLAFPTQTAGGTYTLLVAAGITSTTGVALASTYETTFQINAAQKFTSTTPVGIPDVSRTSASLGVPQSFVIGQVAVQINMVNSVDGSMVLYLIAPDGTMVLLSDMEGGAGQGFQNTVFDDNAGGAVANGQAPFTGSYKPETPLAALSGKNALGTWKLLVIDHATNYYVTLTSWSLIFSGPQGTSVFTQSLAPAGTAATAASAAFLDVAPAQGGDFAALLVSPALWTAHAAGAATAPFVATTAGSPPALTPPGPPSSLHAADALFASEFGVDRLAELRAPMPGSPARTDFDGDEVEADRDGDDLAVVCAADA